MKWYSNYLTILKAASTIAEEEAGKIYASAFKALKNYGVGYESEGRWVIEDDGLIYALELEDSGVEPSENEPSSHQEEVNEEVIDLSSKLQEETVEENTSFESIKNEENANYENSEEDEQEGVFEDEGELPLTQEPILEEAPANPFDEPDDPFATGDNSEGDEEFNPFANNEEVQEGLEENNPFDVAPTEEESVEVVNPFDEPVEENEVQSSINAEEGTGDESSISELASDLFGLDADESLEESNSNMELELSPEDLPIPELPLSLKSKDFTFSISAIKTKDLKEQATFLVAPLRLDVPEFVAVVKATINGETFVTSTETNGRLEFETDKFTYSIHSRMIDGVFSPEIIIKDEDMSQFDVKEKTFGNEGHIALVDEDEGIAVHIFPTSFASNNYGTADFVYCVDTGDGEYYTGTNGGDKSAFVTIDGHEYEIVAKWSEGTLFAKIE